VYTDPTTAVVLETVAPIVGVVQFVVALGVHAPITGVIQLTITLALVTTCPDIGGEQPAGTEVLSAVAVKVKDGAAAVGVPLRVNTTVVPLTVPVAVSHAGLLVIMALVVLVTVQVCPAGIAVPTVKGISSLYCLYGYCSTCGC
jgi:hypothetical protein